jgi:hypothetical protein
MRGSTGWFSSDNVTWEKNNIPCVSQQRRGGGGKKITTLVVHSKEGQEVVIFVFRLQTKREKCKAPKDMPIGKDMLRNFNRTTKSIQQLASIFMVDGQQR